MNTTVKNILGVIAEGVAGGSVNMGIIMISGSVIPPPQGADVTTMEGLEAAMHLFEPKHFLMPFLAHAIGTLVGAYIAALIASTKKMYFALGVGAWYLLGGTINVLMLPSPMWFTFVDLIGAYIPMAYLAGKFAMRKG